MVLDFLFLKQNYVFININCMHIHHTQFLKHFLQTNLMLHIPSQQPALPQLLWKCTELIFVLRSRYAIITILRRTFGFFWGTWGACWCKFGCCRVIRWWCLKIHVASSCFMMLKKCTMAGFWNINKLSLFISCVAT